MTKPAELEKEETWYDAKEREITVLILDGHYAESADEADYARYSFPKDSGMKEIFDNLYQFALFENRLQKGSYGSADSALKNVEKFLLPGTLHTLYDETTADFSALYTQWLNEQSPLVLHGEEDQTALYDVEDFRKYVNQLEDELLSRDFSSAFQTKSFLVSYRKRTNGMFTIPEELDDKYAALFSYTGCIQYYQSENYLSADGCLIALEYDKDDLPSSLWEQYEEFAKVASRKALDVHMAESLRKQKEKEESKNQYSSGCDDEYNACEYSNAYDFWYWNEDFFIDFEEAEEYWEKYH